MAQFRLPKNSRIREGKHFPAPDGASRVRTFRIYRWDPDSGENPRIDRFDVVAQPALRSHVFGHAA